MNRFVYILTFSLFLIFSCVEQPPAPDLATPDEAAHGAFVLCEGIWMQGNSSLSRISSDDMTIENNFYAAVNGDGLGDVANDIVISGDTAFIVVSSSKLLEIISVSSGKHLGSISFEGKRLPRKISIYDDGTAFVTDLYDNSISKININTYGIVKDQIPVGPAPEGILCHNGKIYVANSGYGDYLAHLPDAGTIYVLNGENFELLGKIYSLPNINELIMNKANNRIYASCYPLPSQKDTPGIIAEISPETLSQTRSWSIDNRSLTLNATGDSLFFINPDGVYAIDLSRKNPHPGLIVTNNDPNEHWRSLAYESSTGRIWIGNARNYQTAGQLIIVHPDMPHKIQYILETGITPGVIAFY